MSDIITITGNVGTHPESKRTAAGVSITTFRLASGQRRYDRATEAWVDAGTNWYSVSAFRGLADHAFLSLKKGDRVILTGRLRVRSWDTGTKQGTDIEIDADAIGHDLRWGTTRFEKDAPPTREQEADAPADAWAAPGTTGDAEDRSDAPMATSWSVPADDAPRELALASAETPF